MYVVYQLKGEGMFVRHSYCAQEALYWGLPNNIHQLIARRTSKSI